MVANKKALIIDDSRTACLVLARQLQKLGIASDSVYSAHAALDYLVTERPDVIFLDHAMPGMDGFEAITLMKSDPNTATIPVMMFTSNSGDFYVSQARALGALDVIQKSMEPGVIGKALSKLGLLPKRNKLDESIQDEISALEKEKEQEALPLTQYNKLHQDISNLEHNLQQKLHHLFDQHLSILQKNLEENIDYKSKKLIHKSSKHVIEENKHLAEESTKNIQKEIELSSESIQNQTYDQQQKIKRLSYIVASQLILILGLVIFQLANNKHTSDNSQTISSIQKNSNEQHALLQRIIENQENLSSHTEGLSAQLSDNIQEINTSTDARYLTAEHGYVIGKILGYSANSDSLNIVNANGYLFQVNADHKIISQIPKQYFREQSCYGDAYVKAHKGMVFTDPDKQLWFTHTRARVETITPASYMDGNNCEPYYGEPVELIHLSPNKPEISGIQSYDFNLD